MANIDELFPSTWLKAPDLRGRRVTVKMSHVKVEDVGDEKKPVLYFQNAQKGLVLNVTNANMIKEITGSAETDQWRGRAVVLFVTKVDFQGKRTDAIRIDYPDNQAAQPVARPAPVVAAPMTPLREVASPFLPPEDTVASGEIDSDDVPF